MVASLQWDYVNRAVDFIGTLHKETIHIEPRTSWLKGEGLRARSLRGSGWLALGTVFEKGLLFLSKIVMARILLPDELGLIVLITGLTGFLACITEVGIKQAVIQNNQGETHDFLNTAWWFQVVRSLGIYITIYIAAPCICRFYFGQHTAIIERYSWDTLYLMIRISFLTVLFQGFFSPRVFLLERKLLFSRVVVLMQGSAIVGALVTMILTVMLRNVWALVLGVAIQGLLSSSMSHLICPFKPRIQFHSESFKELLHYARGMLGAPFLAYLALNIDIIVGGRMLEPSMLGLYGFAVVIARIPRELFGRIVSPVLMPSFARCQDNAQALRKVVLQLVRIIAWFGFVYTAVMFTWGEYILVKVYRNPHFAQVAQAFGFFCLNIVFIIMGMVFSNVLLAFGYPSRARTYSLVRAILLSILIVPAINIAGINGLVLMLVFTNLTALVLAVIMIRSLIGLRFSQFVRVSMPALMGGALLYGLLQLVTKTS